MDHFHLRDGAMYCEDVPLSEIAAAVGTPVYVYSTGAMLSSARAMQDALTSLGDPLIAFAVKANSNVAVLATLARQGLGADIVSGGEYARARAAGVPPERIVFSGVGKTEPEMAAALEGGLFQFSLESLDEAETLSRVASSMGKETAVAFRVNPDVVAGTHGKISTGSATDKFGIPIAEAPAAYARVRQLPGLRAQGVAVHIGSQLTKLEPLEAAFIRVGALIAELRAAGHDITIADLGGGLGVPYDPDLPPPPGPEDYAAMVRRVAGGWGCRLVFEPGRVIVGNAGVLLSRAIRVKPGPDHPFLILDAAMNDLMRPALYDAWHEIRAVRPSGERMVATIVGPVCESGDTFAVAREMDRVAADELVIFRTAGAYAAAMGNSYNSRPLTPEVLVDGNRWSIVRERVGIEAMIAGESLPDWLALP